MNNIPILSFLPLALGIAIYLLILVVSIRLAKKHGCYYGLTRRASDLKPKNHSNISVLRENISENGIRYKNYCHWLWPASITIDMIIWSTAVVYTNDQLDGNFSFLMLTIWMLLMFSSIFRVYEMLINFLSLTFIKRTKEDINNLWDALSWSLENENWSSTGE